MYLRTVLVVLCLLLYATVQAAVINLTFDGSVTNQVIDGFGVNANHRSWNNDELKPVLDALIDQAGMTLFRVIYDNTDWEATNDNSDPNVMNWSYYSQIYQSAEFTKLWNMTAYLNSRGITNGVFFNFQGPGPAWMGGSNLTPGLEPEWAEMIASLLVWARFTNGLQFQYVEPNNEPDQYPQGIHVTNAAQYVTSLHDLSQLLDSNGMSDVQFTAPDLANADTNFMQTMMSDPVVMAKLAHFGVHTYATGGGGSAGIAFFIQSSPYPDRRLWVTEFNALCSVCDFGQPGTYDWAYCELTAENLLYHLLNNASAGIVWEAYDSYYMIPIENPPGTWSFWGLFAINDTNAPVKTYTPRKNFYTMAQISKWVRPGAQRIGVSGSTGSFSPLLAFSHAGRGQVTIVGINTSTNSATLQGSLASLPTVPNLGLYYTSATTNLAYVGSAAVSHGSFSEVIPGDCIFTLTGFTSATLTNGIPFADSIARGVSNVVYYHYTVTNPVARVQFEILNPTGPLTLVARSGSLPQYSSGIYDYISNNPGTNNQFLLVLTNSAPVGVSPGDWFLAVVNNSNTAASYSVKATQWADSGQPILLTNLGVQNGSFCFSWNSLPGANYVVQAKVSLTDTNWTDVSSTITATDVVTSYCQATGIYRFFRLTEGVSLASAATLPPADTFTAMLTPRP